MTALPKVWEQTLTLREAAFCRLTMSVEVARKPIEEIRAEIQAAFDDTEKRVAYGAIPLTVIGSPMGRTVPVTPRDRLTLHPVLQDLANLIAWEAEQAFVADYYPRLPDVDVPERHVRRVMTGLQREMDGEANRRHRKPVVFAGLPWERQCALAERRRWWYGLYGITPRNWRKGTWSLWRVNNEVILPQEVKK